MAERLVAVLAEFTRTTVDPFDRDELLHQLIMRTLAVVDVPAASLLLADGDGELRFAAASGPRAARMEQAETGAPCGVCHHAFTTNQSVVARDLDELGRWPEDTERAIEVGFGSVLVVPLNAFGQTIGVLSVYRDQATEWTDREIEVCEVLAAMGASYILSSSQLQAQHILCNSLQTALTSRIVIEQAKGILMATEGLDSGTAFETLRTASRNNNRRLREVAEEIVDRYTGVPATGAGRSTTP